MRHQAERLASLGRAFGPPPKTQASVMEYRDRQLRRLITHAYEQVPFYQQLFAKHGLKPRHIRTAADLSRIPITTREDLQNARPDQLIARGVSAGSLIVRQTSGSSGKPLSVRRTWLEERIHNALAARTLRSYGLRITGRHCYVMSPRGFRDNRLLQRAAELLGLWRHHDVVNCFQSPEEMLRNLLELRPDAISGFPVVLARLSQAVSQEALRSLKVRFLTTGGEVMTPLMRRQISEGFGAPVHDVYGSQEFHLLAWECPQGGDFHVADDGLVLEVVRGDAAVEEGETGEVVGTNLHSFAMPIIRYQLGDVVTRGTEPCPCGQPFSTIRAIRGRMRDYFLLPGDRVVHPYQLAFAVGAEQEIAPWIREFQMVQERQDLVVMRVIPFFPPSPDILAGLQRRTRDVLGDGVTFEVSLVSQLELDPSGKFRVYRSLVESPYDGAS